MPLKRTFAKGAKLAKQKEKNDLAAGKRIGFASFDF